jgi:hypothetical protein
MLPIAKIAEGQAQPDHAQALRNRGHGVRADPGPRARRCAPEQLLRPIPERHEHDEEKQDPEQSAAAQFLHELGRDACDLVGQLRHRGCDVAQVLAHTGETRGEIGRGSRFSGYSEAFGSWCGCGPCLIEPCPDGGVVEDADELLDLRRGRVVSRLLGGEPFDRRHDEDGEDENAIGHKPHGRTRILSGQPSTHLS